MAWTKSCQLADSSPALGLGVGQNPLHRHAQFVGTRGVFFAGERTGGDVRGFFAAEFSTASILAWSTVPAGVKPSPAWFGWHVWVRCVAAWGRRSVLADERWEEACRKKVPCAQNMVLCPRGCWAPSASPAVSGHWVLCCFTQIGAAVPGWTLGHPKPTVCLLVCTEKAVTHPCSSQGWGSSWSCMWVSPPWRRDTPKCPHRGSPPFSGSAWGIPRIGAAKGCVLLPGGPTAGSGINGSGCSGISASSRAAGAPPRALELTPMSIQIAPEIIRPADACPSLRGGLPCSCGRWSAPQSPAALPPAAEGSSRPRAPLPGPVAS